MGNWSVFAHEHLPGRHGFIITIKHLAGLAPRHGGCSGVPTAYGHRPIDRRACTASALTTISDSSRRGSRSRLVPGDTIITARGGATSAHLDGTHTSGHPAIAN